MHPHPLLAAWLERNAALPGLAALEQRLQAAQAVDGIARPRLCAQTADLLADGRHYESRIAECGLLATRENNAHDVFNALIWLRHAAIKWALNARQVADIARVGPRQRTRGQCAITHFDEAGAIVWLTDDAWLPAWDAHDWPVLFGEAREAWGRSMAVTVLGHALLEHVWNGHCLPVSKTLVVRVNALPDRMREGAVLADWHEAEAEVAARIVEGNLLADPQELRPLPLAGIPGWHADNGERDFIVEAPCFRPLRAGRRYPGALKLSPS